MNFDIIGWGNGLLPDGTKSYMSQSLITNISTLLSVIHLRPDAMLYQWSEAVCIHRSTFQNVTRGHKGMENPMLKIRRWWNRLIFNTGFPIPLDRPLDIETDPRPQVMYIISLHRMSTCNELSVNECGVIRQVFVVWFDRGADGASYHWVDSSPCWTNPIRSIDGSSPIHFFFFFCFITAHHEIFNRKLQKCHVIYTRTIQWKPRVRIYTHLTYCLPTGQLYVGCKMFTFVV